LLPDTAHPQAQLEAIQALMDVAEVGRHVGRERGSPRSSTTRLTRQPCAHTLPP
jgi:hypothetical protein